MHGTNMIAWTFQVRSGIVLHLSDILGPQMGINMIQSTFTRGTTTWVMNIFTTMMRHLLPRITWESKYDSPAGRLNIKLLKRWPYHRFWLRYDICTASISALSSWLDVPPGPFTSMTTTRVPRSASTHWTQSIATLASTIPQMLWVEYRGKCQARWRVVSQKRSSTPNPSQRVLSKSTCPTRIDNPNTEGSYPLLNNEI